MAKEKKDFRILFRLWRYVLPYRWQFALGVAAMVAEAAAHSGIPVMLKPFIDDAFFAKDPDMMLWAPAALVGLFILRGLMSFANSISVMWISGNIVLKLREEMFTRIVDLPTPFFDDAHSGALINKITHNATQISATTTKVITVLVKDSMTVIFLVGYVVWLNWKLSLLLLIMIPIMTLVVRKFAKRMRRLSHQFQDSMGDLLQVCQETVGGHSVVKIFGGQNYERKRFHHVANWTRRYHFKLRAAGAANVPIVQILVGLITATVMYLGLYMIEEKVLTEGEFISYLVAIGLLSAPIKQLTAINQPLQKGIAAAENIFGLMDEPPEPDTGTKTQHMDKVEVRFNQVFFRYQNSEADVLSDISFTIPAGKTVALIGASGSGKSTIASLLPRFYEADSGRITLNDTDITELTLPALREHIALVTQHVTLFNDTIRANIAYGFKKPPPDEEIEKAARAAHAWEFIDALPEGLNTLVGENGTKLSGGQRQRLAIARALLRDSPVLILDEATSALDTESENHVQAALENVRQNRTTLVIAHRLSTIERADQIIALDQGRIVERGTHTELLAKNGVYADLYNQQFRQQTDSPADGSDSGQPEQPPTSE